MELGTSFYIVLALEQNSYKNVFNGPAFFRQTEWLDIEKVQKGHFTALEFRTHRRQANQEQAKQAQIAVIIIQLSAM